MFVFLRVDSAQAHCVRACPVINAGLGRTSTNERQFLSFAARSPRLVLSVPLCASLSLISQLPPQWSPSVMNATLESRSGSLSDERRCQTDYPAAGGEELDSRGRDISECLSFPYFSLSPQSAESVVTPGLLPVGVKPCFQSILMHNQQGFPFQLNSYTGTLHVLSSMQILLDFPRIWADFLPWIFPYKCL